MARMFKFHLSPMWAVNDYEEEVEVDLPADATPEEIEAECREIMDTVMQNNLDSWWEEVESEEGGD